MNAPTRGYQRGELLAECARAATFSAFCLAAPASGSGKTTLALGLLAALRRRGLTVQPFKCGPDYIDAGHHFRACGVVSRNLDPWMMGEAAVQACFARAACAADVAVVEGVMGLFDGAAPDRIEGSSAHVARLLGIPVVLVVEARAMARSIAPLVKGFAEFEPGVRIVGVIANGVSTASHGRILEQALSAAGLPPLLGCLPRKAEWSLPERHLGLIAETEAGFDEGWFQRLAEGVEAHIDIPKLLDLAIIQRPKPQPLTARGRAPSDHFPEPPIRIGIARDEAFHFYYEDNLDRLRDAGAKLVPFSPLNDAALPSDLDALYIGGGFPEMFAARLSANRPMRASIRHFAAQRIIYAECGGLMYLGRTLSDGAAQTWEMCGVLPLHTAMGKRLCRLGYVEAKTLSPGLLGPAGTAIRGHEFHWSAVVRDDDPMPAAYRVRYIRDNEMRESGVSLGNAWASYLHLHFASNPAVAAHWVEYLLARRKAGKG
jgi:cobyrinic acid a,c-diamide synthase